MTDHASFFRYLDESDFPCAEALADLWHEVVRLYPDAPLPACSPCENGQVEVVLDSGARVLQLDLWPDGGEIFWMDRGTMGTDGDEDKRPDWKAAFLERLPWFLS